MGTVVRPGLLRVLPGSEHLVELYSLAEYKNRRSLEQVQFINSHLAYHRDGNMEDRNGQPNLEPYSGTSDGLRGQRSVRHGPQDLRLGQVD